ncbi:MAG: TetR/AcrR family transcriptional regulator [Lachnospiraceae bacterium]|nr:TetR/AcrR family transcriptional regulator [Lachnospiraceae bacterium]
MDTNDNNEKITLKERIIECAWELFYEKGYDETTIVDIIEKSNVAKGSFYYHFKGKDTLLNTLSNLLDANYIELDKEMSPDMNSYDKLLFLNYRSHQYIQKKIDSKLLARLYSAQLVKEEGSSLLDKNRYYFKLVTRIVDEGQKKGELIKDKSVDEIVTYYSMCERALVSDWCMNNGEYDLAEKSKDYLNRMMITFKL